MARLTLPLALALVVLSPRPARAGITVDSIDFVQLMPFAGSELVRVGFGGVSIGPNGQPLLVSGDFVTSGFTFGGVAGVRLAPFSFGLLFQHTSATTPNGGPDFDVNKVYGQFGINSQFGSWVLLTHFDFGYAFLGTGNATIKGFGGKIGMALDFYPVQVLSIGAGGAFDVQGYSTDNGFIGGYGGTFVGRLGLHL
jgi:hypothetical protein